MLHFYWKYTTDITNMKSQWGWSHAKRPMPENINDQMMDAVVHIQCNARIEGNNIKGRRACVCGNNGVSPFTSKENLLYQTFTRFDKRWQRHHQDTRKERFSVA